MAHEGQQIENPITGQVMRFIQLREDELRIENAHPPTDQREPAHIHPHQESGGDVTKGSLVFEIDGARRTVSAGESIAIPAATPHRFWNESGEVARSVQFFRPALDIASFFETYFELARRGDLSASGDIPLMQVAVMVPEFADEIRVTNPPWPVVRATSMLLGPLARARGRRGRLAYGD